MIGKLAEKGLDSSSDETRTFEIVGYNRTSFITIM
jgi:hypothetical protein